MSAATKKIKFNSLVSESEQLMRKKDHERAAQFLTEALELEPTDKQLRLQRAQCYILMGLPDRAVMDADELLRLDKSFWRAVLMKAEALYMGGNFEFAFVHFHRGSKVKSDIAEFRLGMQKCKAAILDSVDQKELDDIFSGGGGQPVSALLRSASSMTMATAQPSPRNRGDGHSRHRRMHSDTGSVASFADSQATNPFFSSIASPERDSVPASGRSSTGVPRLNLHDLEASGSARPLGRTSSDMELTNGSETGRSVGGGGAASGRRPVPPKLLLGPLHDDMKFLASLSKSGFLAKPVGRKATSTTGAVQSIIDDGLAYLNKREDFWRQQNAPLPPPRSARGSSGSMSARQTAMTARMSQSSTHHAAGAGGAGSQSARGRGPHKLLSSSARMRSSVDAIEADTVDASDEHDDYEEEDEEPEEEMPLASAKRSTSAGAHATSARAQDKVLRPQPSVPQRHTSGGTTARASTSAGGGSTAVSKHAAPLTDRSSAAVSAAGRGRPRSVPGSKRGADVDFVDDHDGVTGVDGPLSSRASGSAVALVSPKKRNIQQTKYAIETLEKINMAIEEGELEGALKYAKAFLSKLATLDLAEKPKILGNLYSLMGTTYLELNKLTLAAIHHRKDLDIAIRYDFKDSYSRALENLGITYERMGDFAQAIRVWEKKLEASTEEEKSRLWEDIGRCYYHLNDCESAVQYALKALEAAKQADDRERILSVQYTIGHTYCRMKLFAEAIPYFEGYLQLSRDLADVVAEANALTDLGNAYLELGDVSKSIHYQQQAMALSTRLPPA